VNFFSRIDVGGDGTMTYLSGNLKAGVFGWKRDAEFALTAIVAPATFLE